MAAAVARAFAAHRGEGLGNFWVDLTRISLYVLLPISIVIALALRRARRAADAAPATSTWSASRAPSRPSSSIPTASQEAIKQLGTNGGGIFNANSAHPYENPNSITNLIEEIEMNVLGYACVFAFGIVALASARTRGRWSR